MTSVADTTHPSSLGSTDLSADQELIRQAVREFAEAEVAPHAARWDETGEFPWPVITKLAELGWLGMTIPEEYGGAGIDYVSYILAAEELSRADATVGVIFSVHNSLFSSPIINFGSEEQKRRFLPPVARGERIGAYCLSEPQAGSDAGAARTTAVLKGDEWILNGTKYWITNGNVAGSFIVFASTDPSQGNRGMSAFVVEKEYPGFVVGKREHMMGIRGSGTSEIVLQDCRVPKENLIGRPGEGFKIAMSTLDGGRIGIAAQSTGIHRACLDLSLRWARERQAFGKVIGEFGAIQGMIAEMATELEAARHLMLHAARLRQAGQRHTVEGAMAKMFASEACNRAADKAVQIHGGFGYAQEYPVERLYRDARITRIYEGTSEIQRLVIARNLLGVR